MAKDSSKRLSSDLSGGDDTIVARATPEGRGALAIIRISGQQEWARKVVPKLDTDNGWRAQLVEIRDENRELIEQAIAIPYRAPKSYTGEDMVELVIHGSTFLVDEVIRVAVAAGCRVAEPGEFTRRAVANGRIDMLQAEAVRDLIQSETRAQARDALRQLQGELSDEVKALRVKLIELEALLEAAIGFEEQGVAITEADLERAKEEILYGIEQLIAREERGERLREGVRAVITGTTNSGKSTLFNYLVGRDRAIVSPEPGTTRDTIEEEIEIAGMKVTIVDTAGVRVEGEAIEREGMRRARASAAEADLEILLWAVDQDQEPSRLGSGDDSSGSSCIADSCIADRCIEDNCLRLRTKADLKGAGTEISGRWLPISVKNGSGMAQLMEELITMVSGTEIVEDRVTISRRHGQKLREARNEMEQCGFDQLELAAEALRWARVGLEELTGAVSDEDVLDQVFSSFCLGK